MPRDRLVDIGLVGVLLDHPVGEALVQIRPQLLGKASVRGLEDERVCETPPTGGLVLRLDETSSFERVHRSFEVIRIEVGGERTERGDPEPTSLDRCAPEDETRRGIEVIEPRGEQRVQGPGDLDLRVVRAHPTTIDEEPLIGEHRRELLQVQRVPLGGLTHPLDDRWGCRRPEQELRDPPRILRRERRKGRRDRAWLPGRPDGALLE